MPTAYLTYADYCRRLFGTTVQKIAIDGGFTCPNRDGTLGSTGCTFCNGEAFVPSYCRSAGSITRQIDEGIRFHAHRRQRGATRYVAYFQSYSGTYAPLQVLRPRYREALDHPKVAGIVVSTRPDCVSEAVLDLLSSLGREKYVAVEYGIESCYDSTLSLIRRGHDFECTRRAIMDTAARGIDVGGHLILGLPGESREQMLAEADILSALPLSTLKLHQLQLLHGSELERQWRHNPASIPPPFTVEDYVTLVADFLRRLRSDIAIERVAAAVPPRYLADPARSWHTPDGRHVTHEEIAQRVRQKLADLQ